jgi:hypothetical protein
MWMVVGGPLVVVVAGFVTFYLAASNPDPVYQDTGRNARVAGSSTSQSGADAPAMQARNHAATGGVPRGGDSASAPPQNAHLKP